MFQQIHNKFFYVYLFCLFNLCNLNQFVWQTFYFFSYHLKCEIHLENWFLFVYVFLLKKVVTIGCPFIGSVQINSIIATVCLCVNVLFILNARKYCHHKILRCFSCNRIGARMRSYRKKNHWIDFFGFLLKTH